MRKKIITKTAKELRKVAEGWDKTYLKWQSRLDANPDDPMTKAAAKAIQGLARAEAGRLRAKASELIGKKS